MRIRFLPFFVAVGAVAGTLQPKEAFEQLWTYDYGQELTPLVAIEALVDQSSNDPAQRKGIAVQLVAILQEPKTAPAARQFICRMLERIGADEHVPILAKLLADPQTGDDARRALELIPGEAASIALRDALAKGQGIARIGLINSLGQRRDQKAIEPLAKLTSDPDASTAKAAIRALGKIGGPQATAALAKAMESTRPELADALWHAQLRCADALVAAGDAKAADAIYLRAFGPQQPAVIRVAALAGLLRTRKDNAAAMLLDSLAAPHPQIRGAAAALARQVSGKDFTASLVARLDKAEPAVQASILDILAHRGDESARAAVTSLIDSPDQSVKLAAIRALGRLGDRSSIEALARLAAASSGAVQQAAQDAMARLREARAAAELLAALDEAAKKRETVQAIELIEALAARGAREALPALDALARGEDRDVRLAALKALGALAEVRHFSLLVGHILAAREATEAKAAEEAALKAASRITARPDRIGPVLDALKRADATKVPPLLRLLGRDPGPEALAAVRKWADGPDAAARDAAVRCLAEWPTAEVAEDLLKLARHAESPTHRVLALRGYLRVAKTSERLAQAVPLVKANEEKLALLAALSDAGDAAALAIAVRYLDDPLVRAEAILACLKLGDAVVGADPALVKAVMHKVLAAKPDKPLADRAQALLEGRRGLVPLFDGKSLDGWVSNGIGKWRVEDGAIVGQGTQKPGYGMLYSQKQYKDFMLRFKYKVLAGNAGFYIRAERLDTREGIRGLQVEIDAAKDNAGLFEVGGRSWVAKPDPKLPKDYFRPRDWNEVIVTAQGRHLTVILNGHKTVDLPSDPGRTEGLFALGMHGDGVHVLFKDIEVLPAP